ncbi:MFS transporter, PAT family, solute carrier family 33 (acetyl-CoA transporter), member 1 [Strigomonas culicis]|uniref:MFS transporter, PAT family, solute carrier family 33 (Acetyl-CoA transporter), member 1 n=1 Tax=Strigomonas culicis TaxID=28005 RepID=S9URC0_9TRYP|nr:MFS transporter, PAT family, solute carrier family 33 (acetyl-CoA transporter), member 1 [Strigomonas culicis]|eukprot:EPY17106.1 MFS transporter, PAT family, solute carrier family 33 (acetyl-CoA transporter), member 1 [Strigomonas culicis]
MGLVVKNHVLHCLVIGLLYFCQGVVQGTITVMLLILLQRHPDLSAADQATLGLPMYAFSFKFVWAPILDRYYAHWSPLPTIAEEGEVPRGFLARFHRRVQWVVLLQFLMALDYLVLYMGGDDFLEAAVTSRSTFFQLWLILAFLAFFNASQDIAVDAWAVEGLPQEEAASAGLLQLVGTLCGATIGNLFVQLNYTDPVLFSIRAFCLSSSLICVVAAVASVILALEDPLPMESLLSVCDTPHAPKNLRETLRDLYKSHGMRDMVAISLTRGWPLATWFLTVSRLISMHVITAATYARFRIYSTILQVTLASLCSSRLLKRFHAASIVQYASGMDFLFSICASLCFVFIADPSARDWYGSFILLPLVLCMTMLNAFIFVANVSLSSVQARRFPHDIGGVLTLLNALGNIGHHVPSTICMYSAHIIVSLASSHVQSDTRYANFYAPAAVKERQAKHETPPFSPYYVKLDVISLSIFFFTVGAILRYRFLVPGAVFLKTTSESELSPVLMK